MCLPSPKIPWKCRPRGSGAGSELALQLTAKVTVIKSLLTHNLADSRGLFFFADNLKQSIETNLRQDRGFTGLAHTLASSGPRQGRLQYRPGCAMLIGPFIKLIFFNNLNISSVSMIHILLWLIHKNRSLVCRNPGLYQGPLQYRPGCTTLCVWLIHSFSSVIKIFLKYYSIKDTHFMNESFIKIRRTFVKSQADPGLEL